MNKQRTCFLIISIVLFSATASNVCSQTFEEFKKQQQQDMDKFKEQREAEMAKLQKQFDEYVKQQDEAFTKYLEQEWEAFDLFKARKPPEEPKPDVIPEVKPEERIVAFDRIKSIPQEVIPYQKPDLTIKPVIQKSIPEFFKGEKTGIEFFGVPLSLSYDKQLNIPISSELSESTISQWWKKAGETNYTALVNQLLSYKNQMALNDWGYYLLVAQASSKVVLNSNIEAHLLAWFLLNHSGYKVKIAYAKNNVSLLLPSNQIIYGKRFLTLNNVNYYVIEDLKSNTIRTYAKDFYNATRFIDFNIYRSLNLGDQTATKTIDFNYKSKNYSIDLVYNSGTVEFLKGYPQVNINVYFDAAVSRQAKESLINGLYPYIADMSEQEAANFLLNFVQTSFKYKKDQDQFGREKFLFVEEVIYYPYSDCEDRSVLFAYLVRELLHLKIIGIGYTGHVATAIHFSDEAVQGNYFLFRDQKYIIADPTYLHAPVGLTMPLYKASEAEVIELSSINYAEVTDVNLWEIARQYGIYRGSNLNDLVFDESGNGYITGYFTGQIAFEDNMLRSGSGQRQLVVTCLDKYGKIRWAKTARGDAASAGYAITRDNEGNILIAGSFEGSVHFRDYTLKTTLGKTDVFIAKYDPQGEIVWAGKAGLDTIDQRSFLKYVASYDRYGDHLSTDLYFEKVEISDNGIFTDEQGINYIAGTMNATTGFHVEELAYEEVQAFDCAHALATETEILIDQNVEKTIAGLCAMINIIRNNGMVVQGNATQDAIDQYNPDFRREAPEIYKKLGNIDFIENSDGIIEIITENRKTVVIDKLKIENNAVFKLYTTETGDERMDVLSGIKVGKFFVWFDLNSVEMYKESGDILFDYASDHSQIIMNLKDDIIR